MAPTTSTTLTLALGDALAVAVMERRGFLPEQFRTFHPGGKLGAQLSKVAQLMHGEDALPLVDASSPMSGHAGGDERKEFRDRGRDGAGAPDRRDFRR
jgi:hypothetical protein